jgi:DNA polymerase-4
MASELDKPNGLTILSMSDIPTRIWPLSVKKINGIGPKATEKLATLGIATIHDLAQADPIYLQTHFGRSYGHWLHEVAHGIDERPIVTYSEPKSLSRESTFEKDLHIRHDRATLTEIFTHLCTRVAEDLQRKGYFGRTIGIKLRFDDFRTLTRDVTLSTPTNDPAVIRRAAGECLRRVMLNQRLRLLGVRVGTLSTSATRHDVESPQGELPLTFCSDESANESKTNIPDT